MNAGPMMKLFFSRPPRLPKGTELALMKEEAWGNKDKENLSI
jgi:hypothetical protein